MIVISVTNMTVDLSSFSASSGVGSNGSRANVSNQDEDRGGWRVHHGGGGGHLMNALQQALQSLGLSTSGSGSSTTTSGSSSNSDGSQTSSNAGLGADLRSFMQALFSAVRSEGSGGTPAVPTTPTTPTTPATPATPSTPVSVSPSPVSTPVVASAGASTSVTVSSLSGDSQGNAASSLEAALRSFVQALFSAVHNDGSDATSTTPGAPSGSHHHHHGGRFSAGLSALITQVSNGNAPSGLQDSFNKLLGDLQPSGGTTTGTSTPVTLQSLLTTLQQKLGYDSTTPDTAVGSSVSAVA